MGALQAPGTRAKMLAGFAVLLAIAVQSAVRVAHRRCSALASFLLPARCIARRTAPVPGGMMHDGFRRRYRCWTTKIFEEDSELPTIKYILYH